MSKSKALQGLSEEELKKQFGALDLNNDGVIDWEETAIALQALGIPDAVRQERWQNAMIKEFGKEKATLNFEEFCRYIRHREEEIGGLFREVDTNGDGLISKEELKNALKKNGYGHSEETLNSIFASLDLDASGDIDANEWKRILFLSPTKELEQLLSDWSDVSAMGTSNIPVPPLKKHSTFEQAVKQVAIGTFAGSIAKTALAPLSRIKVMIQVAEKSKSFSESVRQIHQEGGIKAFYRGNLANILKSGPQTGAKLVIFDYLKETFGDSEGHLSGQKKFVAGGVASILSHTMFYPLDVVKTRLEATSHGTYHGFSHCASSIYKNEGFSAFYRGLVPLCLGTFPSSGITLGMYTWLSDIVRQKYGENANAKHFAAASTIAALVSECTTYPLHLAKSRLAVDGTPGMEKRYTGLFDLFQKVYAQDGIRGFYRGLIPATVKHVPSVAITMTTYDVLKKYFGITKGGKHD